MTDIIETRLKKRVFKEDEVDAHEVLYDERYDEPETAKQVRKAPKISQTFDAEERKMMQAVKGEDEQEEDKEDEKNNKENEDEKKIDEIDEKEAKKLEDKFNNRFNKKDKKLIRDMNKGYKESFKIDDGEEYT